MPKTKNLLLMSFYHRGKYFPCLTRSEIHPLSKDRHNIHST